MDSCLTSTEFDQQNLATKQPGIIVKTSPGWIVFVLGTFALWISRIFQIHMKGAWDRLGSLARGVKRKKHIWVGLFLLGRLWRACTDRFCWYWFLSFAGCKLKHVPSKPRVRPHSNNTSKQYDILIARRWMKTMAIRCYTQWFWL